MNNIIPAHFDIALRQSETAARKNVQTLHAALGAFVLLVEQHLPAELHELFHAHAVDIDRAVSELADDHGKLLGAIALYSAIAKEFQLQRDNIAYEYKDALDRADEAENTAEANIYQRLLDNVQETFYCDRATADALVYALWDCHADVPAETAGLLDSIANVIDEHEQGF